MTRQETGIIMDILDTAYPSGFSGPRARDRARTLSLWAEMFADDDVALVAAAVKAFIAGDTKGFLPCIGEIKNLMYTLTRTGGLDGEQAWELLRKAASRSAYGAQEAFDRLPEAVQRMTSPSQLYEYSQMDSDTFNSVIGSHFRRAWNIRQESARRDALLPADVRSLLSGAAGPVALEAGKPSPAALGQRGSGV